MKKKISDKARLRHILDAISEIESYTKKCTLAEFESSSLIKNASMRQLEIIGEAAAHLTEETKTSTKNIPWGKIVGLRNYLIHEYFGTDDEITWDIIQVDLPKLKLDILKILEDFDSP
jgi:uncharacterized protein with HEPN domain